MKPLCIEPVSNSEVQEDEAVNTIIHPKILLVSI